MSNQGIDPQLVHAWLAGRSIARNLPQPIPEFGGFRVDTNSEVEVRRWVFPKIGAGLRTLARALREPRYLIKLCGDADELRSVLPDGWQLHAPSYIMQAGDAPIERPLPQGYRAELVRTGAVVEVRISTDAGALAASGYAGETPCAYVYDRIVTAPEHRRQGLGRAVMMALRAARHDPAIPELLVATDEGRALYATMGWRTIAPYSTASIVDNAR